MLSSVEVNNTAELAWTNILHNPATSNKTSGAILVANATKTWLNFAAASLFFLTLSSAETLYYRNHLLGLAGKLVTLHKSGGSWTLQMLHKQLSQTGTNKLSNAGETTSRWSRLKFAPNTKKIRYKNSNHFANIFPIHISQFSKWK